MNAVSVKAMHLIFERKEMELDPHKDDYTYLEILSILGELRNELNDIAELVA